MQYLAPGTPGPPLQAPGQPAIHVEHRLTLMPDGLQSTVTRRCAMLLTGIDGCLIIISLDRRSRRARLLRRFWAARWGALLRLLHGVQHEGGHEDKDHLGIDLHNVFPQKKNAAAQLARDADHILGIHLPLRDGPPRCHHCQIDASGLHCRQQIHLRTQKQMIELQ